MNAAAANSEPVIQAVNQLGLDLLSRASKPDANALLSPYSIQAALAMTFAGADGETKAEMARVLHYGADDATLHASFSQLQRQVSAAASTADTGKAEEKEAAQRVTLALANRLFGQNGYGFRAPFLSFVREHYGAPLQATDFARDPDGSRKQINGWVEEQTRQRIRELIPPDGIDKESRLVLVNAVYLKAPWAQPFPAGLTKSEPFKVPGREAVQVPTMSLTGNFGYQKRDRFTVVTIPYQGGQIQCTVLLPDESVEVRALESNLTPPLLEECGKVGTSEVKLFLPKFRVEPPLLKLSSALKELGMRSAFDVPRGSANFDQMAPRKPDEYLYLSEVFHKTFINLDEKGTEAAAATAAVMARATAAILPKPKPIEVKVDRPFLYAIQHRPTGACLFLGRIVDPR